MTAKGSSLTRPGSTELKVNASGVVMAFGGVTALNDVDFWIAKGGAVGLLGQNGSGKTTLLNVITGHLTPQQGSVVVNGSDMAGAPPNQFATAGIARVYQTVQVFNRLTVLENMHIAQIGNGRRAKTSTAEAMDILERVRLAEFASSRARDISYGHQRLLEIAMALAAGADLILLDEPTAGLAPALVESIVECLLELKADGVSIVLIEHETDVVFKVCDVVWVLNEGRVLACGSPAEIRSNTQVLDLYLGHQTND